ncbi:hypothetical protein RAS1_27690 [Phycisphaerae bacterium RAS1]|nr:hypothetical protein RAS1_27690 [Phycisphaerae bacterium RAS1]
MTPPTPAGLSRRASLTLWIGAFLTAGVLYAATADRGPQWQDAGQHQCRMIAGDVSHPRGLVLTHPVHFYLGRWAYLLLPFEPAYSITLVSSIPAAAVVANVALLIALLTRQLAAALPCAAALMMSHTFWSHATHTEAYGIVMLLLTSEWLCLLAFLRGGRSGWLLLLAGLNGLGVANHLIAGLVTPVYVTVFLWALLTRKLGLAAAGLAVLAWIAGTLPYSLMIAEMAQRTGSIAAAVHSALFGDFQREVLNTRVSPRMLLFIAGFVAYNFPGLTVPAALLGLVTGNAIPRVLCRVLAAQLVIFLLFATRYSVIDQYSFLFPAYVALAVLGGSGLAFVLARAGAWRRPIVVAAAITALWTPAVYLAACQVCKARGYFAGMVGNKPYRDGYRALFLPWGFDKTHVTDLNRVIYRLAGRDGLVLVGDTSITFGVLYEQFVGRAPATVTIEPFLPDDDRQRIARRRQQVAEAFAAGRAVVLVPGDRDNPASGLENARFGRVAGEDVYLLEGMEF